MPPRDSQDKRKDAPALVLAELTPDMEVGWSVYKRWQYWDYQRTLKKYRATVVTAVELTQSLSRLHEARRELDQEKERLVNIETYREGAALEAEAFVREVQARYNIADKDAESAKREAAQAKIETYLVEKRLENVDELVQIEKEERALKLKKAKKEHEEFQSDGMGFSYRERRRQLEQRRKDYEALMADKQADIEKYGGEDKLPHWLQTFYDQAEEDIGFGER